MRNNNHSEIFGNGIRTPRAPLRPDPAEALRIREALRLESLARRASELAMTLTVEPIATVGLVQPAETSPAVTQQAITDKMISDTIYVATRHPLPQAS